HAYRVRALPDADGSRASNEVTHHVGVLTPSSFDCDPQFFLCRPVGGTRFELSWTPVPGSADRFEIARRTLDKNLNPVTDWSILLPPTAVTMYTDSDLSGWVHSNSYEYRLTAVG